jgi:hypothetical protein
MATPGSNPPSNPIERLALLSSQRTARTDRLHEAVCALLAQLDTHCEVGTEVTVCGHTLRRTKYSSDLGFQNFWSYIADDAHCCELERDVDSDSYLHGDFRCPLQGPTRDDLIAFASRAGQFVEALIKREEKTATSLVTSQMLVDAAAAQVRS